MRILLFALLFGASISLALGKKEDCIEEGEICAEETEYNKYLDCLKEYKGRSKRSLPTCPFADKTSCEYVDCNECSNCQQGGCSNDCRRCCVESCDSQLCCHKTCNNQCKTNYCRSTCRRDCKERIITQGSSGSNVIQTGNTLNSRSDTRTMNKHNITTIINLHNIINNTNQIDIPIKINNTNYNNITLATEGETNFNYAGGLQGQQIQTDKNGNRCCQVIGPRVCQKVDTFPYMRCFHYRKHRCGPYCNAPVVHAQPQQVCEENRCHSRMIYIPQPQPRCFNVPYWPYVNCGGNEMANCHGCYKHYTHKAHIPHGGCSRCYDDGYAMGPLYRQGPFYRPGFAHVPSCLQTGMCGMGMGMGMMPYGMGMDYGMGMMPNYGMGMGMGMYPPEMYSGALGGYPVNNLGYPPFSYNMPYVGQNITVLPGTIDESLNPMSAIDFNISPTARNSRYAAVIIDGPETNLENTETNELPMSDQPDHDGSDESDGKVNQIDKIDTSTEDEENVEKRKTEQVKHAKVEVTTEKIAQNS